MSETRIVHAIRIPQRTAPFQIDFPESVLDINGRPCKGSMHLSGGSHYELSPEQLAYVRDNDRKTAALLIEVSKRERKIVAPPAEFNIEQNKQKEPIKTEVKLEDKVTKRSKAGGR